MTDAHTSDQTSDHHAQSEAHANNPHLQHHFDSMEQQYESGKLGMWLFLVTEVLLFGGLFCAYAVYRHNHPEIFAYAHQFLDKTLGGFNTIVLIFSSLTMAVAVRAAQLGQKRLLTGMLTATLVCAFVFMGVKYVEYQSKWKHGLLWGTNYQQQTQMVDAEAAPVEIVEDAAPAPSTDPDATILPSAAAAPEGLIDDEALEEMAGSGNGFKHGIERILAHGTEKDAEHEAEHDVEHVADHGGGDHAAHGVEPANVHLFFGIYFVMTGLHGIHVLAGIGVIVWLLIRSMRGEFGPDYFAPVDFTGLYWHVVDLVWIFLFPLLYLIE